MQINLNLQFPSNGRIPTFQETVTALGSIPSIFWRALEFGTAQDRSYFDTLSDKEQPRPYIREMIVRDQTKRFLARMNFQVEDEDVTIGNEPLVALAVRFGPIPFRILKSKDGLVPGCADSVTRRKFYNQRPQQYIDASGKVRQTKLNLILLWNFDALFNLGSLWLVYPRTAGATPSEVKWHWHEALPHPALSATVAATSQDEASLLEEALDRQFDELLRGETDEKSEEEEGEDSGTGGAS